MKASINGHCVTLEVGQSFIGYSFDKIEFSHSDIVALLNMNEVDRFRYINHIERRMRPPEHTAFQKLKNKLIMLLERGKFKR